MRTTITLSLLLSCCSFLLAPRPAEAQLVYMPDTNLRELFSPYVDANGYIDPADPDVMDVTSLDLYITWSPADLTGIEAFTNANLLVVRSVCYMEWTDSYSLCQHDLSITAWPPQLTGLQARNGIWGALPAWPSSLISLELEYGTWSGFPAWPSGLTHLEVNAPLGVTAVPPLPSGLTYFKMNGSDDLVTFPDLPSGIPNVELYASPGSVFPSLPASLTQATIIGNTGVPFPALPSSLIQLSIGGFDDVQLSAWPPQLTNLHLRSMHHLTQLPAWPAGLTTLNLFQDSLLVTLPAWPSELNSLSLAGIAASTIPPLPASLAQFSVHKLEAMTVLPVLPSSLTGLTLGETPIAELPELPASLTWLLLDYMPTIHCLPLLPDGLGSLSIDPEGWLIPLPPTDVHCLPNLPSNLDYYDGPGGPIQLSPSLLCTVLNSTCDLVNPVATGSVYWDQNSNGTREVGEPGYPFAAINAQPNNIIFSVPASGDYELPLPLSSYTLTASSDNPYVQSISPASHNAPFVNPTDVDAGNDFGVVLEPNVQDLRIDLFGPCGRPGYESHGHITFGNIGSIPMNGTITFELDADQSWVSADPVPAAVNGNTITWDFTALQVGESRSIGLTVYTDPGVPLGTALEHTATVGPLVSDETPGDNVSVANDEVFGSFDPNDKQVVPHTLTPEEVLVGTEVIYTIRFQNTGTYPADRVKIQDQLSPDLQWNSFRFISSSHPCTWLLLDDGTLRFSFNPIVLPDSTSDEPNSHGFVRFGMKPVTDLMPGETVINAAGIIFDFNEPVITNDAVLTIEMSTGLSDRAAEEVVVYPSPADDRITIGGLWEGNKRLLVRDAMGRVVIERSTSSAQATLPVDALPVGGYTVQVLGEQHAATRAFVKR
jgi:uncharacterized repeat protein (TIGR01451 family)